MCWYKLFTVRISRMLSRWRVLSVCLCNVPITVWQNFLVFVLKWSINNCQEDAHVKCIFWLFFVNQCLVGSVAVTCDWDWQSSISMIYHNYSLEGNGKWVSTTLASPASEQVMWNTIFLLLYCEPLITWRVTELIKDYVQWEDSIERKKGNFQILKGYSQKLTELPL